MNIEISTIKDDFTNSIKKYAEQKIGQVAKYLPDHAKKTAKARVVLEKLSKKRDDQFHVEVQITVPEKTLTVDVKASTITSAIDIALPKILSQVRRYKTESTPHLGQKKGFLHKIKRQFMRRSK